MRKIWVNEILLSLVVCKNRTTGQGPRLQKPQLISELSLKNIANVLCSYDSVVKLILVLTDPQKTIENTQYIYQGSRGGGGKTSQSNTTE